MSKLRLSVALADYDHTRDLVSGRVRAEGLDLVCSVHPVEEIFYRMLLHKEWDVSEISLAKYVALRAQSDDSFVAIPVFPSRVFRHGSLYVRADGPVKTAADLKGKRVGLPEWAQTAAVYSRGFLVAQFGLDLRDIRWVQAGVNEPGRIEKVALNLPDGIEIARIADKSLNDMLLSGEIDAALAARPPAAFTAGSSKIRRLFDDLIAVETDYYKKTGIFPIMHAVAIRKPVYEANPWIARSLFAAFEEARRRALARLMDATVSLTPLPWGYEYARRMQELFGDDYFPYGIEPNRKTLEAFIALAHAQGVCSRKVGLDELFPAQLAGSYKV